MARATTPPITPPTMAPMLTVEVGTGDGIVVLVLLVGEELIVANESELYA
jgi:hypothetical protein